MATFNIVRIVRLRTDPNALVDVETPVAIGQFGSGEHLQHVSRICVEEEEQQFSLHLLHFGLAEILSARTSIIRRHIVMHLVRCTASALQRTGE